MNVSFIRIFSDSGVAFYINFLLANKYWTVEMNLSRGTWTIINRGSCYKEILQLEDEFALAIRNAESL